MKKTTNTERILAYSDEQAIRSNKETVENLKEKCNKLLAEFDNLFLSLEVTELEELRQLIETPENYVKNQLLARIDTPPSIAGLPLSKDKLYSILEVPDLTLLVRAAEGCRNSDRRHFNGLEIKQGKAQIKQGYLEQIEEAHSFYLTNPQKIEAYNAHLKLVESVNKLSKIFPIGAHSSLSLLCINKPEGGVEARKGIWLDQ